MKGEVVFCEKEDTSLNFSRWNIDALITGKKFCKS